MKSLTYGTLPNDLELTEPYPMRLRSDLWPIFARIVNQGIDSHLEAVITTADANTGECTIENTMSMRCFIRRCIEDGSEDAMSFASDILSTLDYEWV